MTPYLIVAGVLALITLVGTLVSYFDKDVKMSTSRTWARMFFLSFVWPLGLVLIIVSIFIWAFGPDKIRQKVFG